jgi:putative ABC transport system permease protein
MSKVWIEFLRIAVSNLWKSKLRTILTVLGVVIGIASLTSMISFGVGMEKNITDIYTKSDVFTSIMVSSSGMGLEQIMNEMEADTSKAEAPPLNDSIIEIFQRFDGVDIAFAEQVFPVNTELDSMKATITVRALPASMAELSNFAELEYGRFYESDSAKKVVIAVSALRKMKIRIRTKDEDALSAKDSSRSMILMNAEDILGKTITVKSKVVDVKKMMGNPMRLMMNSGYMPMKETSLDLIICGIIRDDQVGTNLFRAGLFIPLSTVGELPRLNFSRMSDLLKQDEPEAYDQVYIKTEKVKDVDRIVKKVREMGYETFTISEQLTEIKRAFRIVDALLGAIGIIALIVSALGIMNTMVMSILERTRDIGVMKAIGGSERDIKQIFFFEASLIGLSGGILGIVLGWLVTGLAQMIMKVSMFRGMDDVPDDLFFFPWWLIISAILFSVLVSLAAGMYPASRAARIDPVKALRHD